jgi:hypothetical protein
MDDGFTFLTGAPGDFFAGFCAGLTGKVLSNDEFDPERPAEA